MPRPVTMRERVAEMMAQGLERWQIAERTGLPPKTAGSWMVRIRKEMGACKQ